MSKHPAFRTLAKTANRVFRERGQHFWHQHDADNPQPIQIIFNDAYAPVDAAGVQVEEAQPTAFVLIDDAKKLAPERASGPLDLLFSNHDELEINGRRYEVESCKSDGYAQLEIKLFRKNDG
ncbi:hypothetical protein D7027_02110 [Ochrobactrum intermedium]|uniref:head-tail joining protein n=1 Tax=Brucella intermedia TaxID=94625 RepID=UPI00128CBE90|nr:hypothetical protein [Brucella intermedia]MPR60626.1 hypothetical protein [Brucella intermedia]